MERNIYLENQDNTEAVQAILDNPDVLALTVTRTRASLALRNGTRWTAKRSLRRSVHSKREAQATPLILAAWTR